MDARCFVSSRPSAACLCASYPPPADISDLQPLSGLRLEHLRLSATGVADLKPLSGMPLRTLFLDETGVSDLEPLRKMPLEVLWIGNTGVKDISPIQNTPIEILHAGLCSNLVDLSPLRNTTSLRQILLPPGAANLDTLSGLRNLRFISFQYDSETMRPSLTAEEFWRTQLPASNGESPPREKGESTGTPKSE
jgi:hypothetical protein